MTLTNENSLYLHLLFIFIDFSQENIVSEK